MWVFMLWLSNIFSAYFNDLGVGCQATDLDVSPGAFQQLADMSLGRVTVTWAWLDPTPTP